MKIKVGDQTFDSADQPILVTFSDLDKLNMKAMPETCLQYLAFPEGWSQDEMKAFLKKEEQGG